MAMDNLCDTWDLGFGCPVEIGSSLSCVDAIRHADEQDHDAYNTDIVVCCCNSPQCINSAPLSKRYDESAN